ncbi:Transketolase 1 [Candidatus Providencia siddallii]|uniref:Transketolase n=1 Tax=Candidatus Providencia siddallii TaxID=1715285 RepID=A0A0M6WAF2_9GAMM|nr:Transketolase 1 [Candidatus Providencia siddallii]
MINQKKLANAIRFLSIDAIQKAKSGHPGSVMGMADIAEVLWRNHINHNPINPNWINRDRFVLSNGHCSMLIYSLLHLSGYNLSIEELKNFRQLHSKTPGHPEYRCTPGIETTTGPLGQGIANAVGFAIAERTLGAQFNRENYNIINHYTYVFMGDGCMMEGISHEVCSLAGTLKLNKLIVFYDKNNISIDGKIKKWFNDDTATRFKSYGWYVINNVDGHNSSKIDIAINEAKTQNCKPTLIICNTTIGFGSPKKSGSENIHGTPLGDTEIAATRNNLNWKYKPFKIPKNIYKAWNAKATGKKKEMLWNIKFKEYENIYPDLAKSLIRRIKNKLPKNFNKKIKEFIKELQKKPSNISSRKASQNTLEILGKYLPELIGGSADLTPSNLTMWSGSNSLNTNKSGNYIHYGVREFGMSAIMNGIALYKGFIPYGGTFLVFSEYARSAVRMAALMKIRCIFVYTHDSIGVGEDGSTHQPVEQLAALRVTPNLSTWRPCDQVESAVAWKFAIKRTKGPSALIFSRQNLNQQTRTLKQLMNIEKGAYILKDCDGTPEIILISTGSEIELAIKAQNQLTKEKYKVRVVSMPSTDVFDKQSIEYKEHILPFNITAKIAIEASISDYWFKYIGNKGIIIGMHTFGMSAPAEDLFKKFNITTENIIKTAKLLFKQQNL